MLFQYIRASTFILKLLLGKSTLSICTLADETDAHVQSQNSIQWASKMFMDIKADICALRHHKTTESLCEQVQSCLYFKYFRILFFHLYSCLSKAVSTAGVSRFLLSMKNTHLKEGLKLFSTCKFQTDCQTVAGLWSLPQIISNSGSASIREAVISGFIKSHLPPMTFSSQCLRI